jgi:hypothetical protein
MLGLDGVGAGHDPHRVALPRWVDGHHVGLPVSPDGGDVREGRQPLGLGLDLVEVHRRLVPLVSLVPHAGSYASAVTNRVGGPVPVQPRQQVRRGKRSDSVPVGGQVGRRQQRPTLAGGPAAKEPVAIPQDAHGVGGEVAGSRAHRLEPRRGDKIRPHGRRYVDA